jgi:hypothetical protein
VPFTLYHEDSLEISRKEIILGIRVNVGLFCPKEPLFRFSREWGHTHSLLTGAEQQPTPRIKEDETTNEYVIRVGRICFLKKKIKKNL